MSEKPAMMPWPSEDFSVYGPVEKKQLNRVQAYVGRVMERNWASIPHVTHHDDIDITEFETRRRAWNNANPKQRRTLLPALIKATVTALQKYPQFNSSLGPDGVTIFEKQYYHIGVAVDVPNGLLVPVIRDCDKKPMNEIAEEISVTSKKARKKGLAMEEMSGGCFTLSSLGHIGGTVFTPIINAPEVAILGITKTKEIFVPDEEGKPVLRKFLPLSLSYDHRVINGADAARFLRAMAENLESFDFA